MTSGGVWAEIRNYHNKIIHCGNPGPQEIAFPFSPEKTIEGRGDTARDCENLCHEAGDQIISENLTRAWAQDGSIYVTDWVFL